MQCPRDISRKSGNDELDTVLAFHSGHFFLLVSGIYK
jgi:hypothetical protein